ncbi:LOW QUALITY PROTEIN: MAP7 domain-containing protein 1-like [Pecten maximus]|uniref:LOW QUALITY PROTEIN: MAP7 domain-containing protein 1-like n=1 Tax=Pecten maximus TaxID=6579 RepID=UPI001458CB34|nr:LOW QUALITY PROTEIN: MAP7 domain-containing protein 1-like [Pecten maximus]
MSEMKGTQAYSAKVSSIAKLSSLLMDEDSYLCVLYSVAMSICCNIILYLKRKKKFRKLKKQIQSKTYIKYEEPEAPVEFGGQYDAKPSLDMNISPKLVQNMDFNMSGITTMDLSTEELCEKGDNQQTDKGDGDSAIANQVVDMDVSDTNLPETKTKSFLMSVPLDDGSMDSGKMTDSVMSMSTTSSVQGSTSSGKKSPSTEKSGQQFISYGRTYVIVNGKMVVDAAKRDKEREREDRIRAQREKLAEERQKKIEEMREQQRLAQEKRERQLDLRRLKIEELRRRDEERRMAVEDRRRKRDETEQARKESIIQKSQERITRYEQWKASGRKGGRVLVYGFGSRTPREVCQPVDRRRSSSHSALIRRSPNGSDSDSWRPQRRAVSACSTVRRHCCIDINRLTGYPGSSPPSKLLSASTGALFHSSKRDFSSSGNLSVRGRPAESLLVLNSIPEAGPTKRSRSFLAPSGTPPTRPKSTMNLSTRENVRLRDPKTTPRKPRPASIAGSVPSFISVESPKGASRSKSTDRLARDRQKTPSRSTPKREKDEQNLQEKKDKRGSSVDIKKLTEKRKAELQKLADKKKESKDSQESDHEKTPERSTERSSARVSQQTIDRLSTPRIAMYKNETPVKTETVKDRATPTRERAATPTKGTKKSVTIVAPHSSPRKTKTPKQKDKENKEPLKRKSTSKESSNEALDSPRSSPKTIEDRKVESPAQPGEGEPAKVTTPRSVSPASSKSEDEEKSAPIQKKTPEKVVKIVEPMKIKPQQLQHRVNQAHLLPRTPASAPKSKKEIEMDEYKAKLAEKRRQAREKAEKEAELERQRLEEIRLAEEERQRQEEEEQLRMEEEASRLAQEARKNEEERLRKAIEAEELRKKEEADRLEQERKQKEEADRKAKEDAERLEKEKQEKAKKDEEERLERKKRLEMIMKRVKSDSPMTGSMTSSMIGTNSSMSGSQIGSMTGSMSSSMILIGSDKGDSPYQSLSNSPSKNSLQSNEGGEDSADEANGLDDKSDDKAKTLLQPATDMPKFKSPLLQKLVENKSQNGGSETPKFKSPLLQNLMGKKRLGMDKTEDKTNDITTNGNKQEEPVEQMDESSSERVTGEKGQIDSLVIADNESDRSESRNSKSDGSVDSDTSTTKDVSIAEQKLGSNSVIIKTEVSSSSLNGVSQNGEMEQYPQELVDSSISMRTADSSLGTSSDQSLGGSLVDSQTISTSVEQVSTATDSGSTEPNSEFEDFIDLSVTNKNFEVKAQQSLFAHQTTDDLLNLNTNSIDTSLDNISSDSHPKPIIAFEDNAARRQEVTDFLS